jgi:catechol 2,3-dioxygenase-like lactoylglutathione lyase family enzyme
MLVSEVRIANLSVASLEKALHLYSGVLGLEVVARGRLPAELSAPWRIPPGMGGNMALLAAGSERTGMLRLVEFDESGGLIRTKADQLSGNGFWALNYRVPDIRELLPRMMDAGVTGTGEAMNWSITDEVEVWDSIGTDPDGVHLDIYSYERGAELRGGELVGPISALQTIAMCVHDLARTRLFYEGLGFEVLWERTIAGLEGMLQIPEGITLHDANLVRDVAIMPGRVELFQFLDTGVVPLPEPDSITDRAVPPARGILSVSMATPDLDQATRLITRLGGSTVAGPVETDVPGTGPVKLATFLGPERECVEIYEPM